MRMCSASAQQTKRLLEMNSELTLVLMIITGLWSSTSASPQDNGTVLAIPLMIIPDPYRDCRAANQSGEFIYGLVAASQTLEHEKRSQSVLYLHNPNCWHCDRCPFKIVHGQPVLRHHLHIEDFNTCYNDRGCVSWFLLCDKAVFGLNYQILDNPTFAAVFVSFSSSFQQVLAIYPVFSHPKSSSNASHVYNIIHGRWHSASVRGFTIQNPFNVEIDVSFHLSGEAIGWMNSSKLVEVEKKMTLRCREVLWIEPIGNVTEVQSQTLSSTVLSSTMPLGVFTNSAPFYNNATFEFNSHLLHQMPERDQWSRTFFIDGTHSEILPEYVRSSLMHEITIVSYTPINKISLKTNAFSDASSTATELKDPTLVVPGLHYEYRLNFTEAQMIQSLEIHSANPVLVLCDTYSSAPDFAVSYSTLVQPEDWYANKQIIVLVHPQASVTYHYHISILVPSNRSDPADIIESESGRFCSGTAVDSYNVRTYPMGAGRDYTLLTYKRSVINSGWTQTRLLLRHSDPLTRIGVTVYAFSEHLHYSYSNGYSLATGSVSEDEDNFCTANVTITPRSQAMAISLGSIFGVAVPAITLSVILIVVIKLRRKTTQTMSYAPLPPLDNEYPYDVFILCGDQDEEFVKECIEDPLKERGYVTMKKNTAPDGIFMLGNLVVADMDHVIKLCSRVIVVCSDHYTSRRCEDSRDNDDHCSVEINCCKEMMSSNRNRVIPVILDGVEAKEFAEFTQHRIRKADVLSNTKARSAFIKKLERDMNIKI